MLTVARAVAFKWTDPVMGERYRPLEVTPPVSVRPSAGVLMFAGDAPRPLERHAAGRRRQASRGRCVRRRPRAGRSNRRRRRSRSRQGGRGEPRASRCRPGPNAAAGALRFTVELGGGRAPRRAAWSGIEHAHIPMQTMLVDADVRLQPIALATGGRRLGYIPGPGRRGARGVARRRIRGDVAGRDDADRRRCWRRSTPSSSACAPSTPASGCAPRTRALMAYVEHGRHAGRPVQHQQPTRAARRRPSAPGRSTIGQHRVTDETAPVPTRAERTPPSPSPTRCGPRDFDGWVQERGLYFAESWDPHYETPLSMHDPGEPPRSRAACCGPATARGRSSTPGSPSSGSFPAGRAGGLPAVREPARAGGKVGK